MCAAHASAIATAMASSAGARGSFDAGVVVWVLTGTWTTVAGVGTDVDGGPAVGPAPQGLQQRLLLAGVKAVGRLVQDEDVGVADHLHGHVGP